VLESSKKNLPRESLEALFDLLVQQSKIPMDHDLFYDWLKQFIVQRKIELDIINDFFQQKICAEGNDFKGIKKSGFDCI